MTNAAEPDPIRTMKSRAENSSSPGTSRSAAERTSSTPAKARSAQRVAQLSASDGPARITPNLTGFPDSLKTGVERLSGVSLDHVRVHRNSPKPAQLNAHAYARGSDIHLAPGQEKHLPHEAWHVVQQAQGRVRPTTTANGVAINDSPSLEHEADRMGAQALQMVAAPDAPPAEPIAGDGAVAQCVLVHPAPAGAFLKGAATALQPDIAASRTAFRNQWLQLKPRYDLYAARNVPVPDTVAYRNAYIALLAHFNAIDVALLGKFTAPKRAAFVTAYNAIRAEEQVPTLPALFAPAQAELNGLLTEDQLVAQPNSAGRIIHLLEAKTETGAPGGAELFGAAIVRTSAIRWDFNDSTNQAWQIDFVAAANPAHGIAIAINAGGHAITVTINDFVVPQPQQGVYEREIADEIARAFRGQRAVGGADTLLVGAGVGALSANDHEKLLRLEVARVRLDAEKAVYDAAPLDPRRQFRWRQAAATFDRQVQAMDLSAPAKRALLQQARPAVTTATKVRAEAHGISHQIHAAGAAAGGAHDPAQDAANLGVRIITPEMIEHLIAVEERPAAQFQAMGLAGGHDETRLRNWVHAHPRYQIVPSSRIDTDVTFAGQTHGLTLRRFAQYRWTGGGAPPDSLALRPPTGMANWAVSNVPKTTVNNLIPFLQDARAAFLNWHGNAGAPERAGPTFGRVTHNLGGVTLANSPSHVEYAGYMRDDPLRGLRKVETLFAAENFMR